MRLLKRKQGSQPGALLAQTTTGEKKEKVTDSHKQSVLLEDHYSDIIYFRLFDTLQCLTSQTHLVPFKSKAALQFARRKCNKHYQGGKENTQRL